MLVLLLLIIAPIVVQCQKDRQGVGKDKKWLDYVDNVTENCHNKSIPSHIQRKSLVAYIAHFTHCFTSMWISCQTSNLLSNLSTGLKSKNLPCSYYHFMIEFGMPSLTMEIAVHPAFHVNLTFYRFNLGECKTHRVQASINSI